MDFQQPQYTTGVGGLQWQPGMQTPPAVPGAGPTVNSLGGPGNGLKPALTPNAAAGGEGTSTTQSVMQAIPVLGTIASLVYSIIGAAKGPKTPDVLPVLSKADMNLPRMGG